MMTLRLDLVFAGILIATAGSELVASDTLSAEHTGQTCQREEATASATSGEAKQRILAEGYSEVALLTKDCDNVWHALAYAEGDPVNVQVTPQGSVTIE
jgi:hypothetical protein